MATDTITMSPAEFNAPPAAPPSTAAPESSDSPTQPASSSTGATASDTITLSPTEFNALPSAPTATGAASPTTAPSTFGKVMSAVNRFGDRVDAFMDKPETQAAMNMIMPEAGAGATVLDDVMSVGKSKFGNAIEAAKNLLSPSDAVKDQVTKDAIRGILGGKADADVVQTAANRMDQPKIFSTIENELKLVKPKIDAEVASNTQTLDNLLSNSAATVTDAAHQVNKTFDDMVSAARSSVGTEKDSVIKSINEVRNEVTAKLSNGNTPVEAVNDVKKLVGDEIKKFSAPDLLNTAGKATQEAYRQAYFSLRNLVSAAEPASAGLNQQIHQGINLQDLLERKFPQLETAEQAKDSYQGARSQAAKSLAKKAAIGAAGGGIGVGIIDRLSR